MRIAIAQLASRAGDFRATAERMLAVARRAQGRGAQLVVFPWALLTGALSEDYPDLPGYYLDLLACLADLADGAPCPLLVSVSAGADYADGSLGLLVAGGRVTPVEVASEAPGCARFELDGASFVVAYTYGQLDALMEGGAHADVTLFVSSERFGVDDDASAMGQALVEGGLAEDVASLGSWLVGVGSVGGYGDEVFCGSSFVLAPWGELAAQAASFEEELLVADVDLSSEGPLPEPLTPEVYDRRLTLWQALAQALSDLVGAEGAPGVALALDGSLSSSVLAVLATDALGPLRVRALVCGEGAALDDARALAGTLRLDAREAPRPLPSAPERAAALAEAALDGGLLPLSSLDKTAFALEMGAGASLEGGLAPLGDVYRSEVVALAHMRNTVSPVIPRGACERYGVPAVEGLEAAGPTPEARLSFVDLVLEGRIDRERSLPSLVEGSGHPEAAQAVCAAFAAGELGRLATPRVVRVSARTVADARRPLGSVWRDRPRDAAEVAALVVRLRAAGLGTGAAAGRPQGDEAPSGEGATERARETLGHLRDLVVGGAFGPLEDAGADEQRRRAHEGHQGSGGFATPAWRGPFSEN